MNEIKNIYAIVEKDGNVILTKLSKEVFLIGLGEYSWIPNILIDPIINIDERAVLTIQGNKHSYVKLRAIKNYNWADTPITDLKIGNKPVVDVDELDDVIFYDKEKDIVIKDIINVFGFIFKKKTINKDVIHLVGGYYLNKKAIKVDITTSIFTINE